MAMATVLFGITFRDALDTSGLAVNLQADAFKNVLVTDTYTPDANTHDFYADITNEIAAGGGYTSGGEAIDTPAPTLTVSGGYLVHDNGDTSWTAATFSAVRGRVYIDDTLASDPLVMAKTFGADYSVTAGTFTIQEAATEGIFRISLT